MATATQDRTYGRSSSSGNSLHAGKDFVLLAKKSVHESTRPHNVRTRREQEWYDRIKEQVLELREENKSWGGAKILAQLVVLDHGLNMAINRLMECRIISELIRENKIKSYYETVA